jgi:hypothetical protein
MPRKKKPKARIRANEKGLLRAAERSGNSKVAALTWLQQFTNAPDAQWPGRGE